MASKIGLTLFLLVVSCGLSLARQQPSINTPTAAGGGFAGGMLHSGPVTGMPFTGTRETEHTQVLADGTHISQKNVTETIYRDAEGRTRNEHGFIVPGARTEAPPLPRMIIIMDPVAGYSYTLHAANKTAQRRAVIQRSWFSQTPAGQNNVQTGTVPENSSPAKVVIERSAAPSHRSQMNREPLGTKVINGLSVEGFRTTQTIAEGEQGNDRPMLIVTETWTSPELKEVIETTHTDPRNGTTVTRLTITDRNNPDPALFEIPADYQIVDQQASNGISFDPAKAK